MNLNLSVCSIRSVLSGLISLSPKLCLPKCRLVAWYTRSDTRRPTHKIILKLNDALIYLRDRRKMWQFFSNEVSFIWLRPPTHPLQMKVWKTEYWCIINQTPPNNIGFRTMYSPYACHDKRSIYESLSFQNHRHLISSKCTYNSTNIQYQ